MTIRTKVPEKLTVFIIMLFFVFVCFSLVCVWVRACVCGCVICKAAASYRNRLKHTIFCSCEIKYTVMFSMMRVFLQKLRIKFIILTWYTFMKLGFLSFYITINAYTQLKNRKCNLKQQPTMFFVHQFILHSTVHISGLRAGEKFEINQITIYLSGLA